MSFMISCSQSSAQDLTKSGLLQTICFNAYHQDAGLIAQGLLAANRNCRSNDPANQISHAFNKSSAVCQLLEFPTEEGSIPNHQTSPLSCLESTGGRPPIPVKLLIFTAARSQYNAITAIVDRLDNDLKRYRVSANLSLSKDVCWILIRQI